VAIKTALVITHSSGFVADGFPVLVQENAGSTHEFLDNGGVYRWDGDSWNPAITKMEGSAGSVWAYGNWPNTWFVQGSAQIVATAVDNSVIYESPGDMSGYNTFMIENTSSVDPVTVQISLDGLNYSTDVAALLADDVTTGGGVKVLSIPTGKFAVVKDVRWKTIRVLKNGITNEIPSIRFAYAVN